MQKFFWLLIVIMLLAACGDDSNTNDPESTDDAGEELSEAGQEIGEAVGALADDAQELAENVDKEIETVATDTASVANEAGEVLEDVADSTTLDEQANEALEDAATEVADEIEDLAAQGADQAAEQVGEMADNVEESAEETLTEDLGTPDNPLIFVFPTNTQPSQLTALLSQRTGYTIEAHSLATGENPLEMLCGDTAHIALLSAADYQTARDQQCAESGATDARTSQTVLALHDNLPDEMQNKLIDTLIQLGSENAEAIRSALGWSSVKRASG